MPSSVLVFELVSRAGYNSTEKKPSISSANQRRGLESPNKTNVSFNYSKL